MSVKALLVYTDLFHRDDGLMRVAVDLAARFGAALIGASASAIEPPFIGEGVIIQEVSEEDVKKRRDALQAQGTWFKSISQTIPHEWRCGLEYPNDFLMDHARAADLVVIGRSKGRPANIYHYLDVPQAILRLGRPTLLVPDKISNVTAKSVVIGWKDTREARRALHDAMPFLVRASSVHLSEVCYAFEQDSAERRLQDVAQYLERHGVQCDCDVRVHTGEPDAAYLVRRARDVSADLIVTGAYGHTRLGEWMFGGVTHELLNQSPVCLLMSH